MTHNPPLVSVIIPAYNHDQYIAATIKSIIAQTYQPIELLIIDDGSADKTLEVIKLFESKCLDRFQRFVYKTQKNIGTCTTLNTLMAMATGKYIYLIASDDIAKPHAIETLCLFLENHPAYAMAVGDNEFIDASGKPTCWHKGNQIYVTEGQQYPTMVSYQKTRRTDINFASDDFGSYQSLELGNYIPNGYLIRHDILQKIQPFTKEAPLEDYYMILQIAKISKIKYLNEVLFSYRWHSNNTSKDHAKMIRMTIQTLSYVTALHASAT